MTAGDVYRALWRHKWFILILTAACVGAAWYATVRQTQAYEASTLVRVQERGRSAGDAAAALQASQDLARTYAKMVGSGALAGEVRTLVATCAKSKARREDFVYAAVRFHLLRRSVPRRRPRAHGWSARAELGSCRGRSRRSSSPQRRFRISTYCRSRLAARVRGEPCSLLPQLPTRCRSFIRKTAPSSERIVTVKLATTSSRVSRHLPLNVAIALVLGLIFSGALALLIELFRDRLPEADELEQTLGHPVLATIPNLRLHRMAPPGRDGTGPAVAMGQSVDGESVPQAGGSRAPVER